MDEDEVADPRLRHEGEIDFLDDAAEIDPSDPGQRAVATDGEDPPGNR